jgi:hypothetical protein
MGATLEEVGFDKRYVLETILKLCCQRPRKSFKRRLAAAVDTALHGLTDLLEGF